ncbi:hypothetical protein NERG_01096 [Nematocida ausubeli]|uniref:Uncharacterized protein n=1 Tax=Nematocida ausubeli (strain ATCC PRA-371 / ERTm2) TaxID=1913371 RepID=H8ZCU9_NEMA1|nr:hypothetical protein NERG_01096 [Nematocida ausubeli]
MAQEINQTGSIEETHLIKASKRRIPQKCRKTEDIDIPSDNEQEGVQFNPNKKVLRAKRRSEKEPAAKVNLTGCVGPNYTLAEKLDSLNYSFIRSVTLAYEKDGAYNFSSIAIQYAKYREEIVEREEARNKSLLNRAQEQDPVDIPKADLEQSIKVEPVIDQSQMKQTEPIPEQNKAIETATLDKQKEEEKANLGILQTEEKQEEIIIPQEPTIKSESMSNSPKKEAQIEEAHTTKSADEENSKEEKVQKEVITPEDIQLYEEQSNKLVPARLEQGCADSAIP